MTAKPWDLAPPPSPCPPDRDYRFAPEPGVADAAGAAPLALPDSGIELHPRCLLRRDPAGRITLQIDRADIRSLRLQRRLDPLATLVALCGLLTVWVPLSLGRDWAPVAIWVCTAVSAVCLALGLLSLPRRRLLIEAAGLQLRLPLHDAPARITAFLQAAAPRLAAAPAAEKMYTSH